MPFISNSELAHFGGWQTRELAGGVHRWGDPRWRHHEFNATAPSTVRLPDDSPWIQDGVEFTVVNTGTETVTVTDPDGAYLSFAVPAGVAAEFVRGAVWHGWTVATAQFGPAWPDQVFELNVSAHVAELNVLERVIDQFGYDGVDVAAVIVRIVQGVMVGSTGSGRRALTTGNTVGGVSWAAGSQVRLIVEEGAIIGGWGGGGGNAGTPGTGGSNGNPGGDGGQALRAEIPMNIECAGSIFGGGGGGGGGGSGLIVTTIHGGGGGGRGVNMLNPGAVLNGSGAGSGPTNGGTSGTTLLAGAGGPGSGGGGDGGGGGTNGGNGTAGSSSSDGSAGGAGGSGAEAISYLPAAGAPVILSGGANILGGTVSEAL
jgi:hypothetical protein